MPIIALNQSLNEPLTHCTRWVALTDTVQRQLRRVKALLALCALAISPLSLLARNLPSQRPTDVTGTITLEGQDDFFLTSNDTVLDNGKRYPIRHMAIWVGGETGG